MDCLEPPSDIKVEVKKKIIVQQKKYNILSDCFIGTHIKNELNDPFHNSSDESYCYDSNSNPFGEYSDQIHPPDSKQTSKVKRNTVSKKVARKYLLKGIVEKHYTVLPSNQYGCKHCDFVTTKRKYVTQHIRVRHLNVAKINQCPYCPYQSAFDLASHIVSRHKKNSEIKWYECHQCGYKAKLKPGFRRHLLTHKTVEEKMGIMRKCAQCPKMFTESSRLRRHTKFVHNSQKLEFVKCYLCDYKSYCKFNLRAHIDKVHILGKIANDENLKTLNCGKCKYKTKFKYCLKKHLEKHSKRILCEKCPYQAHSSALMKLHMISHQKVKNEKDLKYRCDKCEYKTYRLYSFQVHKLNHLKPEEIQYFYCYHCEFKAKRKDNLKTHIQNHFKKKEFICYICDFKTNIKVSHIAHLGKHSREQKEEQQYLETYHNETEKKRIKFFVKKLGNASETK